MRSPLDYNSERVPFYAPSGFPDWTDLEADEANTRSFAKLVESLQRELGTTVDGYCGPATINAIAEEDRIRQSRDDSSGVCEDIQGLFIGPRFYETPFPAVTYVDDFEVGDTAHRDRRQDIRQVIFHFDVTFDARQTAEVLENRGYSTHFTVDGDLNGTIHQHHNPATDVAYHVGEPNNYSVGVDLNNPALPKYLDRDAKNRGRKREVVTTKVHGRDKECLSYFPEQIHSAQVLTDILTETFDVPKAFPTDSAGNQIRAELETPADFEGVLGHYHWTRGKWDPAPLDFEDVVVST